MAKDILEAVYADIKAFSLGARQGDDITLVIVRVQEERKPDWTI
jgi:serine phosphatase RsbU (regulator of sigma subunit)